MSYRNLRNFREIIRCIGYSRSISVKNSTFQNFGLVTDLLDDSKLDRIDHGDLLIIFMKIEISWRYLFSLKNFVLTKMNIHITNTFINLLVN